MRTYGPDRTNHWKRRLPNSLKDLGRNYNVFDSRPPCRPAPTESLPAPVGPTFHIPSNTTGLEWRALDDTSFGKRLRKRRGTKGNHQQPYYDREYGEVNLSPQVGVLFPHHPPSPTPMPPDPCSQAVSASALLPGIVKEEDGEVSLIFPSARPTLPPLSSVLSRECWAAIPEGYHDHLRRHAPRKLRPRDETFLSECHPPSFSPPPTAVEPPGIPSYCCRDSPDFATPPPSSPTSRFSSSSPSASSSCPPSLSVFHSRSCVMLGAVLHTSDPVLVSRSSIPPPLVSGHATNVFSRFHISATRHPGAPYTASAPLVDAVYKVPPGIPGHAPLSTSCSCGVCLFCVSREREEAGTPRSSAQGRAVRGLQERKVLHSAWLGAIENEREREALLEFASGDKLSICPTLPEEPLVPLSPKATASSSSTKARFRKRKRYMKQPSHYETLLHFSSPIVSKDQRPQGEFPSTSASDGSDPRAPTQTWNGSVRDAPTLSQRHVSLLSTTHWGVMPPANV